MSPTYSVLYIDPSYTGREVRQKKQESFFLSRHASGFFKRVWSVHPLADLVGSSRGGIDLFRLAKSHIVIEGKVEAFQWPKFLLPLNFLVAQARLFLVLRRVVRKHDVSLVVATDPFWSGLLGLALTRTCKKPFGIRIAGNYDDLYKATGALAMPRLLPSYWLQTIVARFVLPKADLVIGVNQNNLGYALAHGARKHTAVIPLSSMAAPVHRIPPSQRKGSDQVLKRLGISGATPILLYIGRLLELKHADDAVRVMAETISKHPSAAGVLAGTGPMLTQLQDLARSLGVEESIHFAGQLDQESLSLLIPRCIIVSPHTGLALIECGLGGAPVVAYDRDWQPEFIQDGVNGFIVPFRDHRAMAQRVDEIVRDHELAHRLSVAMRARAERHIDPEEVKRLEWGAFAGVLDRWSSSNSRRG